MVWSFLTPALNVSNVAAEFQLSFLLNVLIVMSIFKAIVYRIFKYYQILHLTTFSRFAHPYVFPKIQTLAEYHEHL